MWNNFDFEKKKCKNIKIEGAGKKNFNFSFKKFVTLSKKYTNI